MYLRAWLALSVPHVGRDACGAIVLFPWAPSLIVVGILGILSIPRTNIIDNYFNNKGECV